MRIPLSKMPATPRQIARDNGMLAETADPAEVPINDFENAQYYGALFSPAPFALPSTRTSSCWVIS